MNHDIPGLEWAVAQRPLAGEPVSGDRYLVRPLAGGVLLAAIDGLGHGPEAARAAGLAVDCLNGIPPGRSLDVMMRECHEVLRGSRGAALTAALYQPAAGTLQWASVGNVEGVLWHRPGQPDGQRQCVTLRGGVVGYQMPSLHVSTLAVEAGDICCLASDGIASGFVEKTPAFTEPRRLADYIMERYGKTTDDAL
ncbi:MAG TPA: SpoIIE family protein phosphatase, partial [Rhodocyclaceae bacterium]|nr:SpoIIE family protein phosphatase [Rhodocyclaceae bacterium]